MESPSEQGKPEGGPVWVRPPLVEMLYGIAVFVFVFSLYYSVQIIAFCREVVAHVPSLAGQGFSMKVLEDPAFEAAYVELMRNGDVVSRATLWSDLIGLLVLFLTVYMWKKRKTATFLGLHAPSFRSLWQLTGAFVVVFAVLEGIAMLIPSLETDFVRDIVGSSTSYPLLILGSAIMPAVFEEFLMRGLLIGSLRHLTDKHVAVAISSATFVVMHMQYEWQLLAFILFPLAIFLGYARVISGSIWVPIFLHLVNNTVALSFPQLP